MLQINSIYLGAMPNGAHYSYHSDRVFPRANADENVKAIAAPALATYESAIQKEDAALKLSNKSLTTDDIVAADKEQDKLLGKYKKAVKSYLDFPNADIAKAAKVLNQHLTDYSIKTTWQIDKEAGMVKNLVNDLKDKYATEVETLGLSVFVTELTRANSTLIELLNLRTEERMTQEIGAMKAARAEVDNAYRTLILIVNAYMVVEGEEKYSDFALFMNALIKEFKQNVLGQSGNSSNSATDLNPTPEEDSDEDEEMPDEL